MKKQVVASSYTTSRGTTLPGHARWLPDLGQRWPYMPPPSHLPDLLPWTWKSTGIRQGG